MFAKLFGGPNRSASAKSCELEASLCIITKTSLGTILFTFPVSKFNSFTQDPPLDCFLILYPDKLIVELDRLTISIALLLPPPAVFGSTYSDINNSVTPLEEPSVVVVFTFNCFTVCKIYKNCTGLMMCVWLILKYC